MRTGPLPPHLKKKVLANIENAKLLRAAAAPVHTSTIDDHSVGDITLDFSALGSPTLGSPTAESPSIATAEADASALSPFELMESYIVGAMDYTSETMSPHPNDSTSEGGSYTSIPNSLDMDIDYSDFAASGPWVAMEHFAGEIIVNNDSTIAAPASGQTGMEIRMLPRLSTNALAETEPPTLLFNDEDVRPDWLISAIKEFLRYTPYYGCLGKVIDQFLLQEARLGYPIQVSTYYIISYKYSRADNI